MEELKEKVEVLNNFKRLLAQVAYLYDCDYTIHKMADELEQPVGLIHEILGFVLIAREPEKYA